MVVLQRLSDDPYQCGTEVKDVHKIANDEKVVPREWVTEDGSYVTDDFVSYVRPLIQGDVSPVMVDGIPRHLYRKINSHTAAPDIYDMFTIRMRQFFISGFITLLLFILLSLSYSSFILYLYTDAFFTYI